MHRTARFTAAAFGFFALLALTSCAASTPDTVGQFATGGQLAPCPDTPNCVNSDASSSDAEHAIAPLAYTGDGAAAKTRLLQVIQAMPRTNIVSDEGNYLHAEFTSLVFRFVDDVEFVVDDGTKTIHFRSASRVGRGDMGVNRKRMEEIRTKFQAGD